MNGRKTTGKQSMRREKGKISGLRETVRKERELEGEKREKGEGLRETAECEEKEGGSEKRLNTR